MKGELRDQPLRSRGIIIHCICLHFPYVFGSRFLFGRRAARQDTSLRVGEAAPQESGVSPGLPFSDRLAWRDGPGSMEKPVSLSVLPDFVPSHFSAPALYLVSRELLAMAANGAQSWV